MNRLFNTLHETEEEYKKLNDLTGKVNAARLQHAVVSVLLDDNEEQLTYTELDVLYDGIDANTGKNTKNPMRNKITGICKLFGMTNKIQFFEKIIAFLEAEVNENLMDLVDGWDMLEKEKYTKMEEDSGSGSEGEDTDDEDEDTDDDIFTDYSDVSGFYVEGDNIENGWGLYI